MIGTHIRRVLRAGITSFWRNGSVSIASISIVVLALFMIGSVLFANVLLTATLAQVESKVDVSVYFKTDALETDIYAIQRSLEQLPEIAQVEYISREQTLAEFRERHRDNALISNSLIELGDNPFGATLNVRAKNPSDYESVALFFEQGNFAGVDKINYRKNKVVIDRLAALIESSRQIGVAVAVVFSAVAMLVVFNTIRLAIFSAKEEIGVMKLVGASRNFIRSPFLVIGTLYGASASIITTFIFWALTFWLGPKSASFFAGIDLYEYFMQHFLQIFAIFLIGGVLLGIVSSYIAVRKYLRV